MPPTAAALTDARGVASHDRFAGVTQGEAEHVSGLGGNPATLTVNAATHSEKKRVTCPTHLPSFVVDPSHLGDNTASAAGAPVTIRETGGAERLGAEAV